MMINRNTLGARASCFWQYFSGIGWHWVCPGQGGGYKVTNPKQLSGLGSQIITPAQMSTMSIQAMQSIIADHQRRIAEIDARVAYEQTLMYPWDDSTKQLWLSEKASLLANIAAIQAWINLPPKQKARTDGGQFIVSARNSFLNSLNKLLPGNYNSFESTPGFLQDTTDFLTSQYAGIPVWGIVALAGAGLYVIASNKKTARK